MWCSPSPNQAAGTYLGAGPLEKLPSPQQRWGATSPRWWTQLLCHLCGLRETNNLFQESSSCLKSAKTIQLRKGSKCTFLFCPEELSVKQNIGFSQLKQLLLVCITAKGASLIFFTRQYLVNIHLRTFLMALWLFWSWHHTTRFTHAYLGAFIDWSSDHATPSRISLFW